MFKIIKSLMDLICQAEFKNCHSQFFYKALLCLDPIKSFEKSDNTSKGRYPQVIAYNTIPELQISVRKGL